MHTMKFNLVSSSFALIVIACLSTHARASVPLKVLGGRRALEQLRAVRAPGPHDETHDDELLAPFKAQQNAHILEPRVWKKKPDKTKKLCGPGVGTCDPGYCCSIGGHCGKGYHYCSGPACQLGYSDACDAHRKPLGEDTLHVPRPLIGNVTYNGTGIYDCTEEGKIALTFDDGPFNFTWHLLDVLAAYGAKATFFITGNNMGKGQMDIEETGYPKILRRMHADGHQIASHTWTHQNITTLNETLLMNQIHYTEMAFRNVLGFFPTYFRPPYSECRGTCQAVLKRMGYHITYYNLITDDYMYDDPATIQTSKDIWDEEMTKWNTSTARTIPIAHDIHYQTAYNLTSYMLDYMKLLKFGTSVTVGECMGDPPENWYRTASGAPPREELLREQNSAVSTRTSSSVSLSLAYSMTSLLLLLISI